MKQVRTAIPITTLHIWRDRAIYISSALPAMRCVKPAATVLISPERDFKVTTPNAEYVGRILLVGANVPRGIDCKSGYPYYSFIIDPIHIASRYLRAEHRNNEVVDFSARLNGRIENSLRNSIGAAPTGAAVFRASQDILGEIFPKATMSVPIDVRIQLVASWLWIHVPIRPDIQILAGLCKLSPSRLAHLFTTEMGLSIRQYLLWVKMRRATEKFTEGISLTEVAHTIGFADSAHLSRTYARYFATLPSVLADRRRVRVRVCDGAF